MQNLCLVPAEAGAKRGTDGPGEDGLLVRWHATVEGFPTWLLIVSSLHDPEAHYTKRRSTTWSGYKVHLTETCDEARPQRHHSCRASACADRGPRAIAFRQALRKFTGWKPHNLESVAAKFREMYALPCLTSCGMCGARTPKRRCPISIRHDLQLSNVVEPGVYPVV